MKLRYVGDNPIEGQVLASDDAPLALLDGFLPLLQTRTLSCAMQLGLFDRLASGARSAEALADQLGADASTLELLMRVLVCAGYLTREADGYALTPMARSTLPADAPQRIAANVDLMHRLWHVFERMDEVLRSGKGFDFHQTMDDPAFWRTYQTAMLELARRTAAPVAELVPVREGAERMLDIGGSHGLFSAHLCRRHPPLRSTVLDLPEAVEQSRSIARAEGIDDVVSHRGGNALTDDLGRDLDLVFFGNLAHHFTPGQNVDLLGNIRAALRPQGTVAIWEIRLPEPDEEPELMGDGYALFFRLTSTARCYSNAEYVEWLETTGFVDVQVHPTPFAPMQVLVTGRNP